jgi:cation diffusion facilitator CzcD-associated flavoprotein CzcO
MGTTAAARVEAVVIGAGVVGLAIARALALRGKEVMILDRAGSIGSGQSVRVSCTCDGVLLPVVHSVTHSCAFTSET